MGKVRERKAASPGGAGRRESGVAPRGNGRAGMKAIVALTRALCVCHSVVSDSLRPHGPRQAPLSMRILHVRILEGVAMPFSRGSS